MNGPAGFWPAHIACKRCLSQAKQARSFLPTLAELAFSYVLYFLQTLQCCEVKNADYIYTAQIIEEVRGRVFAYCLQVTCTYNTLSITYDKLAMDLQTESLLDSNAEYVK